MKKYGIFKIMLLMLALLMAVSMASSCAFALFSPVPEENEETTTEDPNDEPSKPDVPSTPSTPDKPDTPVTPTGKKYTVTVINGDTSTGSSLYTEGEEATLVPATPPNGYVFSHWETADGEKVSASAEYKITVNKSVIYKAYFAPVVSTTAPRNILTDLGKDWQQGGLNTTTVEGKAYFDFGDKATPHRVSFAKPLFLPAGATIKVTLPAIACPTNGKDCPLNGNCGLTAAICILQKNVEGPSENNDDFTIASYVYSATPTYTATTDTYIQMTVKYDKHGSTTFNINNPKVKGGTESAMSQLRIEYSVPKAEGPTALNHYWGDELTDTINKIDIVRENASSYLSEFFFITDTHWKSTENAMNSPALITYLAEKVDNYNVVFGGDVIYRYNDTKNGAIEDEIKAFYSAFTDYTKVGEKFKIFTTLGNHDRNGSSNQPKASERLSEQEAYDLYLKRVEGWGVTEPGNPNQSYYDDTVNKVRYVQFYFAGSRYDMIEDGYVDSAFKWASEKISELDETWTVVLFTHGYFCDVEGGDYEITEKTAELTQKVLELKASAEADIAAWITGHNHEDRAKELILKDTETDEEITRLWVLSLTTDAYSHSDASTSYKMTPGTVTEQSFSFIQVDVFNKNIHVTRVGVGEDAVYSYGEPAEDAEDDGKGSNANEGKFSVRVHSGTLEDGSSKTAVDAGTELKLIANEPTSGNRFLHWKNRAGEIIGTEKTITVKIEANDAFIAIYEAIPVVNITLVDGKFENGKTEISISADDMITIIADEPSGEYDPTYWEFSHWVDKDGKTIGNEKVLYLEASEYNDVWTVVYKMIDRPVSFVVGGTFEDGTTSAISELGETVTLIADEPTEGMVFSHWENSAGETVGETAECTVAVTKNDTYTAIYKQAE